MQSKLGVIAFMNKRILAVLLLGFYSGLPFTLTTTTLQAWFASNDIDLVSIGALTLVGLPYIYKFLWAPFLDRFNLLYFLPISKYKTWMVISQSILAVCIALLAFVKPAHHAMFIVLVVFIVAFTSATQDCVIDAFRTELLEPDERGFGSACYVFAYRVAVLVSGGLGLIVAGLVGFKMMFLSLSLLMGLGVMVTLLVTDVKPVIKERYTLKQHVIEPIRSFLTRDGGCLILVFILIYKFGDAFAQSLLTAFFVKQLHFTLVELGSIYKMVGLLSAVLGSFIGGILLPKLKLYRSLMAFGFLQAIANLYFICLLYTGHNYFFAVTAVMFENITAGITSTVFVAFMMSICDLRFTTTQFALMTALAAVGRVALGPIAGFVTELWGWQVFFVLSFIIVLPSLWLLNVLNKRGFVDSPN